MSIASETISKQDIQKAFDLSQFFIVVQPQCSLVNDRSISAVEAFIRLKHPTLGVCGPHTFLPQIQEMELQSKLASTVAELAGKAWSKLANAGHQIGIAINVDIELLMDDAFISELERVRTDQDIPEKTLILELVAEPNFIFSNAIRDRMMQLRLKGYRLSLNDMELSPTILSGLKTLPIDEVKVPVKTVSQIRTQAAAQTTMRKIMYYANQYGLGVVAVGLEHESEEEWLQKAGICLGQGYLYGKPMEIEEFVQFLNSRDLGQVEDVKTNLNLLALEDEEYDRKILNDSLGKNYNLHVAGTIAEGERLFHELKPELVLFDVHLPDGTGIELCKKLKADPNNHAFSAVFLSGTDDPVLKVQAYEVGAIDFLFKPCPVNELLTKIDRLSVYHKKAGELAHSQQEAQSLAVQSLKEASSYGDIIQFIKNLLHCRDEHAMALELFSFMEKKSLLCSVEMRGTEATSNFKQNGSVCSPMEINVFELLKQRGRIYEFGERLIFNDRHVSILIKKVPDNEEEKGRIRDYLAVVIESMEARYQDILRHRVLKTVFQQLQSLATDLVEVINDEQSKKNKLLDLFSLELGSSFHILHLNEDQESYLTNIIETMLTKKEESELSSDEVSARVTDIMDVLNDAMDKIENPMVETTEVAPGETVELF
jgi:EAL domain-containing protein (putative c-di-GMP-specific phosphodiesterase class I)/DNA-binding response OmpR family regulator